MDYKKGGIRITKYFNKFLQKYNNREIYIQIIKCKFNKKLESPVIVFQDVTVNIYL